MVAKFLKTFQRYYESNNNKKRIEIYIVKEGKVEQMLSNLSCMIYYDWGKPWQFSLCLRTGVYLQETVVKWAE